MLLLGDPGPCRISHFSHCRLSVTHTMVTASAALRLAPACALDRSQPRHHASASSRASSLPGSARASSWQGAEPRPAATRTPSARLVQTLCPHVIVADTEQSRLRAIGLSSECCTSIQYDPDQWTALNSSWCARAASRTSSVWWFGAPVPDGPKAARAKSHTKNSLPDARQLE